MKYQRESKTTKNPFKILSKKKIPPKNLGINLTREMKDLYTEKYKNIKQ